MLPQRLAGFLWLHLGQWLAGRGLDEMAAAAYRHAASEGGAGGVQAAFLLGRNLLERGRAKEALTVLEDVVVRDPRHARGWVALGAAHRHLADLPAARSACEAALAIAPRLAPALCNLGELDLVQGRPEAALARFDQALAADRDLMEAYANRVAALFELARYSEALAAAERAIERYPREPAMHVNHGNVLLHTGKGRLAVKAFRQALEIDPACAEAHMNLATLFGETEHLAGAVAHIQREIAVKGETAQRLGALALAQSAKRDYAAAEGTCRKALAMQPAQVSALITLAGCLSARGEHREAIALHEKALAANPEMPAFHSNIAFDATYLDGMAATEVFAYHRNWSERFEIPRMARRYSHPVDGDGDRKLKIGYVSGDFGSHPVGFLLRDVIQGHDSARFEIHCFSMMRREDDITAAIRKAADFWHDVLLDSDDDLARHIHDLDIDVLVDLAGHTAYNRLPVFVLKPAPVQVTWIGYFHSTGLESIDYFITDPHTSPRGCGQLFSETPVWLPHSRFCYSPPDYAPAVAPPPTVTLGRVTFGCFNRLEKLVTPVFAAWAEILRAVPESRLLLKAGTLADESLREHVRRRFADHGIASERLELRGPSGHADMFAEYGDIDIALDPFPFNGGMTTLEALWMGVPVVALKGNAVVSRQSHSFLANLGLDAELAFGDIDSYVAGAIALARDPGRLAALREHLRPRMAASPLCQPELFCRELEGLYRRMWQACCRGEKLPSDIA